MAIEFECPNCGERYRLRDDVGGKKAKCKNPQCGKMMLIPQAKKATVPPTTPPPDLEATALTALNDQPEQKEEAPAVQDIPLTCTSCDHQWAVPIAMAGKNVICPECTQRIKVPVPKKHIQTDWRQGANTGKPSLAKENFEKPKDVISSEGSVVSREAWQKGGGADQDLEPIPLKRRLMVIVPIVMLVGAMLYGVVYLWNSRVHSNEVKLFAEAQKEFAEGSADAPLLAALLHMAEAEYDLRDTKQDKFLPNALTHLANARSELSLGEMKDPNLRTQAMAERNAFACELALMTLEFGGNDEQVKAEQRIRWIQEQTTRKLRVNEKTPPTIHDELRRTLTMLKPAEFDLKTALIRRLTRELNVRGQPGMAEDLPALLFDGSERDDARALVTLELFRVNASNSKALEVSGELARQYSAKGAVPPPPFVQGLWLTVGQYGGKPPPGVAPLTSGTISDATRIAYTCQFLLQDKPAEAFAVANRPGDPLPRIRALVLCAEWSPDRLPALEAARAVIPKIAGPTTVALQSSIVRLSQLASIAGRPDLAIGFADTLTDDGLKAWAKGESVRWRMTAENKSPADEAWAELPDDPKKVRVGHAWGRLWIARQNARVSGDLAKEKKAISGWPNVTIHPFGLAGIALGLQDRQ